MRQPDKLEQRLSSLVLTKASGTYFSEGQSLLKNRTTPIKTLSSVRLNYALGFCLLLSVAFNVIQFEDSQTLQTAGADQCEPNSTMALPDMSPLNKMAQPVFEPPRKLNTISSGLLC